MAQFIKVKRSQGRRATSPRPLWRWQVAGYLGLLSGFYVLYGTEQRRGTFSAFYPAIGLAMITVSGAALLARRYTLRKQALVLAALVMLSAAGGLLVVLAFVMGACSSVVPAP